MEISDKTTVGMPIRNLIAIAVSEVEAELEYYQDQIFIKSIRKMEH